MAHVRFDLVAFISCFISNFLIMKKELIITFGLLLLLTLTTFVVLNFAANNFIKRTSIIILFSAKFLLVVFQFMELKKAHVFWKTAVVLILALVNLIIIFSLNE